MQLCKISIPRVETSTSRVLATSTINKRHWGLLVTAHKKTMEGIKGGNLYFNHVTVIHPCKNKNWILLMILMFYYW